MRTPLVLLLTLLAVGLIAAGLTSNEMPRGEFILGIGLVHVAFGFAYGSWGATTGSLLWLPLGPVVADESNPLSLLLETILVPALLGALIAAGVGVRKLLGRSSRWRVFEKARREPSGRPTIGASVTTGVVLAVVMWAADALTGSPLLVYITGFLVVMGTAGRLEARPTGDQATDGTPIRSAKRRWKRLAGTGGFICALVALALILEQLGGLLGLSQDSSENGPIFDSLSVWALLLAIYVGIQAQRQLQGHRRLPVWNGIPYS